VRGFECYRLVLASLYFWSLSERSTKCNIFVLGVGRYSGNMRWSSDGIGGRALSLLPSFAPAVCTAGVALRVLLEDGFETNPNR
jgi:hypothetical protein